jgi:hypothetical protein
MKSYFFILLTLTSLNIFSDIDETVLQAPLKDKNTEDLGPTKCITRDHLRWDVCFSMLADNTESMRSFRFSNDGENKIVPKAGFGVGRSFEFLFEDKARSDLGLLIWDMPDEVESHGHLKLMMFFPRTFLPRIRYQSNDHEDLVITTLSNGEEVNFNGKTKEIVSGVLAELPMAQDNDGNGLEPQVNYTGNGVVLWAHRLNDYPVGVTTQLTKSHIAYAYKKNYKLCKLNGNDLWYTDQKKGGNIFFNQKYSTDKSFDQLLKSKCGFSMY